MSDKESTNTDTTIENSESVVEEAVIIESDPVAEDEPKKVRTGGLWLFSIINFLLIIGACAAGIWAWYQWQQLQNNESEPGSQIEAKFNGMSAEIEGKFTDLSEQVEAQLASMGSAISKADTELADINRSLSEQNQSLSNNVDNLMQQVLQNADENKSLKSRVADLSGRRPADWLLAEADYLVRIAGRKLWLENDVGTAVLMLQSADSRLEDLNDPSLFPVRALIAEDIQALNQVNPVSLNSVALALSGMIPQVNSLPLNAFKIPEIEEDEAAKELSDNVSDWRTNLSKSWAALVDDFIQIETSNQPVLPYLSTKQRWLITEQLKLALSQAKSAALAEQEILYVNSLQQANALVLEHFQIDDNSVIQFSDALQKLQSTVITKDYPRELQSSNALKDVIAERVQSVFKNNTDEGAL